MSLDLSAYKVGANELSSSTKFDNLVQAVQDALNNLGNATYGAFASGLIFDPAKLKQNAATNGQALAWNGTAWTPTTIAGPTTYRKTTSKTVNTTVAETDLLNGEITVAANVMSTNKLLRLTAWGDWKQNSGGAADLPRFKLLFGGATLIDSNATGGTVANSATRRGWKIVAEILNLGATNSQWATMKADVGAGSVSAAASASPTTGEGTYSLATNVFGLLIASNTGAVDTTAGCALALSVINASNNANYETKLTGALVEII